MSISRDSDRVIHSRFRVSGPPQADNTRKRLASEVIDSPAAPEYYGHITASCQTPQGGTTMTRKGDILYSAERIAKFFGVSKKTARQWCKTGKLPAFKIGKEWKIRVSDLQKMIDRKIRSRASDNIPRLF